MVLHVHEILFSCSLEADSRLWSYTRAGVTAGMVVRGANPPAVHIRVGCRGARHTRGAPLRHTLSHAVQSTLPAFSRTHAMCQTATMTAPDGSVQVVPTLLALLRPCSHFGVRARAPAHPVVQRMFSARATGTASMQLHVGCARGALLAWVQTEWKSVQEAFKIGLCYRSATGACTSCA